MRYNRFYSDKVGRYILNRFQDYFSKIQRSSIRKSRNENNMCHKKYIERNSRMRIEQQIELSDTFRSLIRLLLIRRSYSRI